MESQENKSSQTMQSVDHGVSDDEKEVAAVTERGEESHKNLAMSLQQDSAQLKRNPTPTWLTSAVLRRQAQQEYARTEDPAAASQEQPAGYAGGAKWLAMPAQSQYEAGGVGVASDERGEQEVVKAGYKGRSQYEVVHSEYGQGASREAPELNTDAENNETMDGEENESWLLTKRKVAIVRHPLFTELIAAHVACLRIATPVDQLPSIDAQLAQSHVVINRYNSLFQDSVSDDNSDKEELEKYMTDNVMLLRSFKEQLQQHVRVHAMEAVMACFELEKQLEDLTGVRISECGQGSGALMSDDDTDDTNGDSDTTYDSSLDVHEGGGFGPLIPTETERSLMERVRQELKQELKQGYKAKIIDVREEILRKRRAGKLPGDTTTVLKTWWHAHAKWPYPTEDEKTRLVQDTGLELKQINNWFINQRKRNWHANPSATAAAKTKRKR